LPGFSKSDGRAASISDRAIPNFSRATWQKQAGGLAAGENQGTNRRIRRGRVSGAAGGCTASLLPGCRVATGPVPIELGGAVRAGGAF